MKPIQRVRQLITQRNMSVSAFERETGMSSNSLQIALKRKSNLKDETLMKILQRFPEISADWLLTGRGTMISKAYNYAQKLPDESHEALSERIRALKSINSESLLKEIPLISRAYFTIYLQFGGESVWVEEMPKVRLPAVTGAADRMFSIPDNGLFPHITKDDYAIVSRLIPKPDENLINVCCIVISPRTGICLRLVSDHDDEHLLLRSELPNLYPDLILKRTQNLELWKLERVYSASVLINP
ncbi:helix-turn-helix domain-containing protein [Robertkochia solimangrovi]|uniref:helix-turn-helix domain-containing protein n=1 Tax=Robertkochia solimangrovi TaxID=2213046 RepID=UPI0011807C69|nr:helix-turn-helix transcriptional regulator [Robertkochia solimangrovi]TRZ42147.1 hypothetical protein DMZ48_14015 [Robertkochia solimangrovi]